MLVASFLSFLSLTVVVPAGEIWQVLVTGQMDILLGSLPTGEIRLQLDGVTVQTPLAWNSNMASQAYSVPVNYVTTLAAGSHTFNCQAINTGGGATFEDGTLSVALLKR